MAQKLLVGPGLGLLPRDASTVSLGECLARHAHGLGREVRHLSAGYRLGRPVRGGVLAPDGSEFVNSERLQRLSGACVVVSLPRDRHALWSRRHLEKDHTAARVVDDPDAPEREARLRAIGNLRLDAVESGGTLR